MASAGSTPPLSPAQHHGFFRCACTNGYIVKATCGACAGNDKTWRTPNGAPCAGCEGKGFITDPCQEPACVASRTQGHNGAP
ncbi:hypothetical protein BU16DRAFT_560293 [Lophium mytilinum]|uniref:Uncharacterized protein n=1 Tax=Lophium mytilinum TaxID=390894 RepID=A0A6A6R0P6_9PEZI|nr:hypothetical protein BU16DRAFT_560293 [Lophium mytilinum]